VGNPHFCDKCACVCGNISDEELWAAVHAQLIRLPFKTAAVTVTEIGDASPLLSRGEMDGLKRGTEVTLRAEFRERDFSIEVYPL
jgi:hypothetical protein